jgi:hypothetical protein
VEEVEEAYVGFPCHSAHSRILAHPPCQVEGEAESLEEEGRYQTLCVDCEVLCCFSLQKCLRNSTLGSI